MDGFTYTNIFDTKGIEYIIVIFFLLLLIPFWLNVNKKSEVVQRFQRNVRVLTARILRIPQGLFFSRNHAWVYLEKTGQAKIGLDDFLVNVLGNISIQTVKAPGDLVKKGEVIALIQQQEKQLSLYAPVTGEIQEINAVVMKDSSMLADDPYNEGWLFSVTPKNWKAETSGFFLAAECTQWIADEIKRLKDFLSVTLTARPETGMAVVFQEGGELMADPLAGLDADTWSRFQHEFLDKVM